ncbi:hypothetical protein BBP40_000657, partial [Aspergillus hancockii]
MASMPTTDSCGDDWFGPVVATPGCRGGFDFTVIFEASILNVVPAACFPLLAPIRLLHLSRQSPKIRSSAFRVLITIVAAGLAAIQVALVVL